MMELEHDDTVGYASESRDPEPHLRPLDGELDAVTGEHFIEMELTESEMYWGQGV